jgi:hypothetical protein
MKMRLVVPIFTMLLMAGLSAFADTISFQEDISPDASYQCLATYIRDTGDGNKGEDTTWQLGTTGSSILRCLLGYDISDIPAGSIINSVTVTVSPRHIDTNSTDADYVINVHEVPNHDYTESSVTWFNRYMGDDETAWTNPGGDYDSTVLSSLTLNPLHWVDGAANPPTAPADDVTYVFASSSAFVAVAQDALDNNHRLDMLLKLSSDGEASTTRVLFPFAGDEPQTSVSGSQRKTVQEQAPILTIDYTPVPEPATWLLCSVATLGLLGYGIRKKA